MLDHAVPGIHRDLVERGRQRIGATLSRIEEAPLVFGADRP
jgi:hypothetical protein